MGTVAFVFVLLSLGWLLIFVLRRDGDVPIQQKHPSRSTEGMGVTDCETCNHTGSLRLDAPWKKLLATEIMVYANQVDCDCCQGRGVHWIAYGGKFRCKYYVHQNQSRLLSPR